MQAAVADLIRVQIHIQGNIQLHQSGATQEIQTRELTIQFILIFLNILVFPLHKETLLQYHKNISVTSSMIRANIRGQSEGLDSRRSHKAEAAFE